VDKLQLICSKEKINITRDSLALIARAAMGSLRDAENILQQLITYHGNHIEPEQVRETLGMSWDSRVRELARCIVCKNVTTGLSIINGINRDGVDLRQFNLNLVEYLRGLLLAKSRCTEALDFTREDIVEMENLAASTTLDYLLQVVKAFSSIDFRNESYSTLPLELALLDCTLSCTEKQEEQAPSRPVERTETITINDDARDLEPATMPQNREDISSRGTELPHDINYLRSRWKEFIASLKGEGSTGNLDAFLRSACDPLLLKDDILVLGFYYSFHKEKIEDPKYKFLVERKLREVFGHPYKIECVLVDRKKKIETKKEDPLIKAALEMGAKISEREP
jgi:DNA polymerase-3 subunit gamma/tau